MYRSPTGVIQAEQADIALPTTALLGAAILVVLVLVLVLLAPDTVVRFRYVLPFLKPKTEALVVPRVAALARGFDHGTHPLVHPLVLGGSHFAWTETPMPASVLVDCRAQNAYFHGLCGHVGGTRLTVRAAALRGLEHAASRSAGKDAAGATWDGRHKVLYVAVADGRATLDATAEAARVAVGRALDVTSGNGKPGSLPGPAVPGGRGVTVLAAVVRPRAKGATVEVQGTGSCEAWLLGPGGWRALRHDDSATHHAPPGSVVVLGTDGFAGALGQRTHLAGELSARWRTPPTPMEFLAQLDFFDGYRTDDRAAVAIWIG